MHNDKFEQLRTEQVREGTLAKYNPMPPKNWHTVVLDAKEAFKRGLEAKQKDIEAHGGIVGVGEIFTDLGMYKQMRCGFCVFWELADEHEVGFCADLSYAIPPDIFEFAVQEVATAFGLKSLDQELKGAHPCTDE